METSEPARHLDEGSAILRPVLGPLGFNFQFRGEGRGSGGPFAWGAFVRAGRSLELHYRFGLGEVTYHADSADIAHEPYMRSLGVWKQCRYPGFQTEPLQAFHDLAHDLGFADDFLTGDASVLAAASRLEKDRQESKSELRMAGCTGQAREIEQMRKNFKAGRYKDVVAAWERLPFPHLLTDAQMKLVDLARARDT